MIETVRGVGYPPAARGRMKADPTGIYVGLS